MNIKSMLDNPPRTVAEAVTCLEAIEALLDGNDVAFPIVYGIITKRVELETRPGCSTFRMPALVSRLAGRFCERYLETLYARDLRLAQPSRPWVIAYELAGVIDPLRAAALCLVAHIHADLPECIVEVLREQGVQLGTVAFHDFKHDHDAVNRLLQESFLSALTELERRYGKRDMLVVARTPGITWFRGLVIRILVSWREAVWQDVVSELKLGDGPSVRRRGSVRGSAWADILTLPELVRSVHDS